jgi:fumarylpyruvate hydrolase
VKFYFTEAQSECLARKKQGAKGAETQKSEINDAPRPAAGFYAHAKTVTLCWQAWVEISHTYAYPKPAKNCRAMNFVFPPHAVTSLPVAGTDSRFPVRRVFCVGRNYADHAREMGAAEQADGREPPFFFMKPADAVVSGEGEILVAYPPMTQNLHHEVEMIVALGSGGVNVTVDAATGLIFGYAVGLDLTRRDIQGRAKEKGHPWDMGKGFDQSAVAGVIQPLSSSGPLDHGRIWLKVNGQLRQDGDLSAMMWKVADIIANLSTTVRLAAGDLIYTGTPAGVGPIVQGDLLEAAIEGVGGLRARIV